MTIENSYTGPVTRNKKRTQDFIGAAKENLNKRFKDLESIKPRFETLLAEKESDPYSAFSDVSPRKAALSHLLTEECKKEMTRNKDNNANQIRAELDAFLTTHFFSETTIETLMQQKKPSESQDQNHHS